MNMLQPIWTCRACRIRSARSHSRHLLERRPLSTQSRFFKVSEEVQQAIAEHRPVVALETTIYTHGFPYPENVALASRLESLVRTNGGTPATIGILDGVARVGLDSNELTRLVSSANATKVLKVSRRDLGFALGLKDSEGRPFNGGTTIAATMILARMAGIQIFATGGLGGVHRGAETTMDVSADLTELGRTPVAVISSGCKAFLDLPKTLEYLETQGVAVATFSDGRGDEVDFPAFFTRESGVPSPQVLKDETEAAKVIQAHFALGLQSGLHFANPIPAHHSLSREVTEAAVYEAIKHASIAGAVGAAATPYILAKIKEYTGDESVKANRALIEANVIRGTQVAKELNRLNMEEDREQHSNRETMHQVIGPAASNYTSQGVSRGVSSVDTELQPPTGASQSESTKIIDTEQRPNVFVAGSLAIDLSCDYIANPSHGGSQTASQPNLHTSNPARISQSLGGVGSNVARAAHLMGAKVRLCSAVADDLSGKAALAALNAAELTTAGVKVFPSDGNNRTAQYVAVNDSKKDLVLAMADMSILESPVSGPTTMDNTFDDFWLDQFRDSRPSHLIIDANWSPQHLARWLTAGREVDTHITFEPVSAAKGSALFRLPKPFELSAFPKQSLRLATPNVHELRTMHTTARERGAFDRADWWEVIDALGIPHSGARVQLALATTADLVDQGIPQQSIQLLPFIPSICTKLGAQGVLLTQLIPAYDERLTSGDYAPYILSRCANGTEDTLGVGGVYMRLFPAVEEVPPNEIVSVNGVGDTFAGTLVAGLASRKASRVEELIDLAQRAAVLTLKCKESVSPGLGTLRILM